MKHLRIVLTALITISLLAGCSMSAQSSRSEQADASSSGWISMDSQPSRSGVRQSSDEASGPSDNASETSSATGSGSSFSTAADVPDRVSTELESDLDNHEAVRKEIVEKFALAVFTNTKVVNGSFARDTSLESVQKAFVSPLSELKEWSPQSDPESEYNSDILMRGGSPIRAKSAVITSIDGDTYYVDVEYDLVGGLGEGDVVPYEASIAVMLDGDMIIHAWHA